MNVFIELFSPRRLNWCKNLVACSFVDSISMPAEVFAHTCHIVLSCCLYVKRRAACRPWAPAYGVAEEGHFKPS